MWIDSVRDVWMFPSYEQATTMITVEKVLWLSYQCLRAK